MKTADDIRKRLEDEVRDFVSSFRRNYSFPRCPQYIADAIAEYMLRDGKRLRPVLYIMSYAGFGGQINRSIYRSALGFEMLHNCALAHDDIMDDSQTRRGGPALHLVFERRLRKRHRKFAGGADMAIAAGDILYSMGIRLFMTAKADADKKEAALRNILDTAAMTGFGQMLELDRAGTDPSGLSVPDLMKMYDMKTSFYTFSCPLCAGAVLAGAPSGCVKVLRQYGVHVGRAFQICDDMKDFSEQSANSGYADISRSRITLVLKYAHAGSSAKVRNELAKIMCREKKTRSDILRVKGIVESSGAFKKACCEIARQLDAADGLAKKIKMNPAVRNRIHEYCLKLARPSEVIV